MARPELVCLSYSPWSEKARFALDHHGIDYTIVRYQPLIGEPALRLRTRRWTGVVSVPVLFADGRARSDSWDIARWADGAGDGAPLFPEPHLRDIERLDRLAQDGLAAGRALGLPRVLEDREALRHLVPRRLRGVLGPAAVPIAAFGVRRTQRKYGAHDRSAADHEATLRDVLGAMRESLRPTEGGGPETLLGRFTYADIAAAQVLQFVRPRNLGAVRLEEASARAYSHPELAEEAADLIAWRDALYDRYRR